MPAISSILLGVVAAGAAVAAVSTIQSNHSNQQATEARQEATQASVQAETIREQQMALESTRQQREMIRQTQAAQSLGLARSVNQGGGVDDTALFGAYGQVQGAYGRASNADYQNLQLGHQLFGANRDYANATGRAMSYETDSRNWQNIGSLGSSLMGNAMNIAQIGNNFFGSSNTRQRGPGIGPWQTSVTPSIEGFY